MDRSTITVGLDVGSRPAKGVLLRGEEILTAITAGQTVASLLSRRKGS